MKLWRSTKDSEKKLLLNNNKCGGVQRQQKEVPYTGVPAGACDISAIG